MPRSDLSRRALLGAGAFGLAMPPLSQASAQTVANPRALGRNGRGNAQAQHWSQDLTTPS